MGVVVDEPHVVSVVQALCEQLDGIASAASKLRFAMTIAASDALSGPQIKAAMSEVNAKLESIENGVVASQTNLALLYKDYLSQYENLDARYSG